jgi:hypothetical protein
LSKPLSWIPVFPYPLSCLEREGNDGQVHRTALPALPPSPFVLFPALSPAGIPKKVSDSGDLANEVRLARMCGRPGTFRDISSVDCSGSGTVPFLVCSLHSSSPLCQHKGPSRVPTFTSILPVLTRPTSSPVILIDFGVPANGFFI